MNSFHPSQDEDYNHEFSKKFMKRWKRLNWSEKYFGSHLRLAYTVRKAAAVVIVILSLAAANQVRRCLVLMHGNICFRMIQRTNWK
jgi:hypothetical protein